MVFRKTKRCPRCRKTKPVSAFSVNRGRADGMQVNCKSCFKEIHAEWYVKNRDKQLDISKDVWIKTRRSRHLIDTYGIDEWDYAERYVEQQGSCGICGRHREILFVDHDHNTGQIRGLLCHTCNMGLGLFKDSKQLLESAYNYLK